MNNNIWVVGAIALLLGVGMGFYFDADLEKLPAEVVYEDVVKVVEADPIIETVEVPTPDPAFADQLEELNVYRVALAYFNTEWQDEIEIGTDDYGDYTEDGSEIDVEETPSADDYSEVADEVTLTETDHEDNEWTVEWLAEFEDDTNTNICYNVSTTVEDGVADDLELTATTC